MENWFPKQAESDMTYLVDQKNGDQNDKTVIELGYRKISWFVSVSQINYLPKAKASANKLICSPLTNHDILLNFSQWLLNGIDFKLGHGEHPDTCTLYIW